jgi:hypothetical protein
VSLFVVLGPDTGIKETERLRREKCIGKRV